MAFKTPNSFIPSADAASEDYLRYFYILIKHWNCLPCKQCRSCPAPGGQSCYYIHEVLPKGSLDLRRQGKAFFGLSITAILPNCYLYDSLRLSLPTDSVTVLLLQCIQHIFFQSLRVPCIKSISIPPTGTEMQRTKQAVLATACSS